MQIKTIKGAQNYLFSLDKKGICLDLKATRKALKKFKNPHLKFKSVLIAGTNGKGSTVSMVSSVLKQAGYHVGTYSSPHLLDVRERVALNGKMIKKAHFISLVCELKLKIEKERISLTYFEFLTVLAFIFFSRAEVDFAVVEVGLGGRWDSTNVLSPLISVITSIGKDHQKFLGNTLEKIATEKAGIIKEGKTLVTSVTQKNLLKLFEKIADEKKCNMVVVNTDATLNYALSLKGAFQKANAHCALAAIKELHNMGYPISAIDIKQGLKKAYIAGRFEKVSEKPLVILDGAHNGAGVKALVQSLNKVYPGRQVKFLVGMLQDKNYEQMIDELSKKSKSIYFAPVSSHRSLSEKKIKRKIQSLYSHNTTFASMSEALPHIQNQIGSNEMLCVTGSLYAVSDAKRCFL